MEQKNYHGKNGAKKLKNKENLEFCLQLQSYLNIMWKKQSLHTQQFLLHCLDEVERVCQVCILLYI